MPGLLLQAASDHGIDLRSSWMVGDILHDVEAGNRAGCRTVLIDNGNETEWRLGPRRIPTRMAPDLYAAAVLIASHGDPA
jgi:histidinol phosphatase-like enzyme